MAALDAAPVAVDVAPAAAVGVGAGDGVGDGVGCGGWVSRNAASSPGENGSTIASVSSHISRPVVSSPACHSHTTINPNYCQQATRNKTSAASTHLKHALALHRTDDVEHRVCDGGLDRGSHTSAVHALTKPQDLHVELVEVRQRG